MSRRYNDAQLWVAYKEATQAGDTERAKRIGGAILQCHKGFFVQYARGTAFAGWSRETLADYQAELVAVALEKMPLFDPSKASFPTYIKRHWLETRWRVHIASELITVGVETARLRTAADGFVAEYRQQHGVDPTLSEIGEYLTERFSKHKRPVGVNQAKRLIDRPSFDRPDAIHGDSDGVDGWALIASAMSVEDVVLESMQQREIAEAIADALIACVASDLERDILRLRMMAPPRQVENGNVLHPGPASYSSLASTSGVTVATVKAAEEELVLRMAKALKG